MHIEQLRLGVNPRMARISSAVWIIGRKLVYSGVTVHRFLKSDTLSGVKKPRQREIVANTVALPINPSKWQDGGDR